MEIKKSPKADLERSKSTWLLIGLVLALGMLYVCFEWTERDVQITVMTGPSEPIFEEEMIPITEQEEQKPTPPPVEVPKQEEILEIADNEADVEESDIRSSEDDNTAVEIKYVEPVVEEPEPEEEEIFQIVEKEPSFPGGQAALMRYLSEHISYPVTAQEAGIQGRVILQFVVNRDGSIVDIQVVRGVDAALDQEAVRVVSAMPKWTPGEQRGKTVRVRYTLPVLFRLN